MEPARSLYKKDVDFEALALQCRDFAKQCVKYVRGKFQAPNPDSS